MAERMNSQADAYAVIGCPVEHSLSPRIHTAFARQTGQTLRYVAHRVEPEALQAGVADLFDQGYLGLNVTLPHKQAVQQSCHQLSEAARIAGAVNTLIRDEQGWRGDNTDGSGFIADLAHAGVTIQGKRVLILGAGGATRGILKPLMDQAPALLCVSNRNAWKPEQLAEAFQQFGDLTPRTHVALKGDQFDLIINATAAGHAQRWLKLPPGLLAEGGDCYDLSYGKAHAPFAEWAEQQGANKIMDGLGMLVEQAADAFALWRGIRPQTHDILAELHADCDLESDAAVSPKRFRRPHVEMAPQD